MGLKRGANQVPTYLVRKYVNTTTKPNKTKQELPVYELVN